MGGPPAFAELFRYRGAVKNGGIPEYVFETDQPVVPATATKEKVAEISADFMNKLRPLDITEMRWLLKKRWTPPGVTVPEMDSEAAVIRITGGNFWLFERLLTQIERIAEINESSQVNKPIVETAPGEPGYRTGIIRSRKT